MTNSSLCSNDKQIQWQQSDQFKGYPHIFTKSKMLIHNNKGILFRQICVLLGLWWCRRINHCGQSHSEQHSLELAFCGVLWVKRPYFTVSPGCLAAETSCQPLQMLLHKPSHVSGPQLPETQLASTAKCLGTSWGPCYASWVGAGQCHCRRSLESLPPFRS